MGISGRKCDIVHKEPIKGEIQHSEISIEAAKKELGYIPEYNVNQGLEKLIKSVLWVRKKIKLISSLMYKKLNLQVLKQITLNVLIG